MTQDFYSDGGNKHPRYYQLLAINKTIEAIAKGQNRILFLADRNILVDQAMTNDCKAFKSIL